MKAHFEKVTDDHAVLYAFERAEPTFGFLWHYHPEYELTLILEGYGQRLVGNSIEDYAPGDLILLGSNLPHTYVSSPSDASNLHRAHVLQFRPERLGESFLSLPEMRYVRRLLEQSSKGLAFRADDAMAGAIRRILASSPAVAVLELLQLLANLAEKGDPQLISEGRIRPLLRVEDQERINLICQFLHKNYDHAIDYAALTELLHMNQASICRFFRQATSRTMTDYVNDYRISAAAQLLTQTSKSILEIAFEVGFGNYSHFNRQFQRCRGMTPRVYRDTWGAAGASLIPAPSSQLST